MRSLDGHLPAAVLLVLIRVERQEQGELGPLDVLPIVAVPVQGDGAGPEGGLDPELRVGLAAPLARFLVRADSGDRRKGEEEEEEREEESGGGRDSRHCDASEGISDRGIEGSGAAMHSWVARNLFGEMPPAKVDSVIVGGLGLRREDEQK